MSESSDPTTSTTSSSTSTNQTQGVVTRSQAKRNKINQNNNPDQSGANSDEDHHNANKQRGKEKEKFKGGVSKMNSHVFQLYEELKKANQFSTSLTQLKKYVAIECEQPKDLATLFQETIEQPELLEPPVCHPWRPTEDTSVQGVTKYLAWHVSCKNFEDRYQTLRSNLNKIFAVILSQSSEDLKPKIESTPRYKQAKEDNDCGWLLTTIKNICHRLEHSECRFTTLIKAKSAVFNYKQSPSQLTTKYYETFKELCVVLELYGGILFDPPSAIPNDSKLTKLTDTKEWIKYVKDKYSAILFIMNSDRKRYGHLKLELSNSYSRGRDKYPDDLPSAHQLLLTFKGPQNDDSSTQPRDRSQRGRSNGDRGRRSERGRGDGGRGEAGRGNGSGSSAGQGTDGGRGSSEQNKSNQRSFSQFTLSQTKIEEHFEGGIPDHYVLLDSDSTVSIFRNKDYLSNVREATHPLRLQTNGGEFITNQIETITDIGEVWYNPKSIANILSLAQVCKSQRIMMDTGVEAAFHVHGPDGGVTTFYEHPSSLYLHDVSKGSDNPNSPAVIAYSNLQTVANNKLKYTQRQVEMANVARKLHHLLGRPSIERLIQALKENHIINCPITADDVNRAEEIYGKDVAFIKGKTSASPLKVHLPDFEKNMAISC